MSGPSIELVVAAARNGVIGRDGGLPWRLGSDLRRFRALTMGKPVLMGRKTFASIGRPLDGRANVVVTRDPGFAAAGVEVAGSLGEGLELARAAARRMGADAVMVIGGAEIYRQCIDLADVVHLTRVDLAPDGDTVFPTLDPAAWQCVSTEAVPAGERDDAGFTVETHLRRRKGT